MIARQLAFTTEAGEIALNFISCEDAPGFDLHGQFLGPSDAPPAPFGVQLMRDAQLIGRAQTDALGEFEFRDVEPGEYRLVLTSGQLNVLIPGIDIRR